METHSSSSYVTECPRENCMLMNYSRGRVVENSPAETRSWTGSQSMSSLKRKKFSL